MQSDLGGVHVDRAFERDRPTVLSEGNDNL
jgi:hypothetical protein